MIKLNSSIRSQFTFMCRTGMLFRVKLTGQEIWDLYLASFTREEDPMFRDPASSVHNCKLCNNFIRRYGNIVAIKQDGTLMSIFDVIAEGEYINVMKALSAAIRNSPIENVFFETFNELNSLNYEKCNKSNAMFRLGVDKNIKRYTAEEAAAFGGNVVKANELRTFNHFHLDVPKQFVDMSGLSIESIMGSYRDKYSVFKRAMEEISLDTLILVKDLINQGSLLDGPAHLDSVTKCIEYKRFYNGLNTSGSIVNNWFWGITYAMHERVAKFKNTLMGVLCSDLSEGKELNAACKLWNQRVDPVNYMKVTAPITQKQIEETRKFVEENGYVESFNRRVANIDDIKVSEILHSNVGNGEVKSVSIFDNVKSTSTQHKKAEFNNVEEVTIERFMKDILPSCTSVEAYLENRMSGNLVTMTTANVKDSKPIFKWPNNYSWNYNGNLAGKSYIKEAVKAYGGATDGVLRFSLMWAEGDRTDDSDLDAHCKEPYGEIYFSNMRVASGGFLDIDIQHPGSQRNWKNVAENISWPSLAKMKPGKYEMIAHCWADRGNKYFEAEIQFGDEVFNYRYDRKLIGHVKVATVTLANGKFTIEHHLPVSATTNSQEIYGLQSNEFHKVKLLCLSPNHWDGHAVGNKHYFFMLDKCISPNEVRSFHNENLIQELADHRRVLEVLGATSLVPSLLNQLSGLGFNATVPDELIVKLAGSFKRVIKIKF